MTLLGGTTHSAFQRDLGGLRDAWPDRRLVRCRCAQTRSKSWPRCVRTEAAAPQSAGADARQRLLSGLPVTERRLQLAGVSTAVLEGGDGPPIVLLQGEFAAVWMRVIPDLVTTHRVIAPDLPGLGASEVSDGPPDANAVVAWLDELIEQTCAIPPVLVGKGAGGALAARFAIDHADRVDRLVLVDTLGLDRFRPPPGMAVSFVGVLLRPTERGLERGFRNYCFVDFDGVRAEMGERYEWMAAYALDRFRTPSVKAAMRRLYETARVADPVGGARPDRRSDDPDLGPTRPRCPVERRRGSQRPPRLAAVRDRQRPRRPCHRAAEGVPECPARCARQLPMTIDSEEDNQRAPEQRETSTPLGSKGPTAASDAGRRGRAVVLRDRRRTGLIRR